jgi:hypothetical protein
MVGQSLRHSARRSARLDRAALSFGARGVIRRMPWACVSRERPYASPRGRGCPSPVTHAEISRKGKRPGDQSEASDLG